MYLVEYAHAFAVLTLDQIKKDLEEYDKAPKAVYFLVPGEQPSMRWLIRLGKDQWLMRDKYYNFTNI